MPGRLAIFNDEAFVTDASLLISNNMVKNLKPSYNTTPTQAIPTLLNNGNYLYTHFGFIPSWAKDKTCMNINARSESIFEKKTFRESFKFRRCIIPINGFYEWEENSKEKLPYFVKDKKEDYLAVAGIWDEYFDKNLNMYVVTVALITCNANEKLGKIHPRMPVVLCKENFSKWLNSGDLQEINSLFRIYPNEKLELYRVKNEVNKVSFNNPSLIEKVVEKKFLGQLSLF